jgi:hypothetical protein
MGTESGMMSSCTGCEGKAFDQLEKSIASEEQNSAIFPPASCHKEYRNG